MADGEEGRDVKRGENAQGYFLQRRMGGKRKKKILEKQKEAVKTVPHDGWVKASLVVDLFLIGNGAEHQDLERRESRFRAAKAGLLGRRTLPQVGNLPYPQVCILPVCLSLNIRRICGGQVVEHVEKRATPKSWWGNVGWGKVGR